MKPIKLMLLSLVLVGGCSAPYVAEYAENQQWQALGEQDAVNGYWERDLSSFDGYSAQAKEAYLVGYQMGKSAYCQPEQAWSLGRLGRPYRGICQDLAHGWSFQQDYNAGRERWLQW
ncbi:DUF2799 domain-containing protein [Thaumasiovibrio sp. DFM-14]|uniref:DUF2799 domain-containing protein n=1 Tax=Thaumasiovibrio sp. DFM-14 TaxID=3384792 RepID=UPI0039A372B1